MSNKRASIYLPIIFALLFVGGYYFGQYNKGIHRGTSKLDRITQYIQGSYVDEVDPINLQNNAIKGMLEDLDPHSAYIPASDFAQVHDFMQGNFQGIGVQFRIQKDTVVVVSVIPGGPSEEVGLMPGDRIIAVQDTSFVGDIDNSDVLKKLKGPKGTKVKVKVFRRGVSEAKDFVITRGVIPTYSVDIAYMLDKTTGIIKLNRFSATTIDEFDHALKELKNIGMEKLILDLRGNAGGYLDAARLLCDQLLPKNKLIVYTEGLHRKKREIFAGNQGRFEKGEIVVLIDGLSASASEIVAGAIQDHDRGVVVGRRSFGKGLVQEEIKLPDNSAIRLTVSRYYTPSGRSIQRPYENGRMEYHDDMFTRFNNGELNSADSIHFNDSLKFYTSKGRVVYGGGGIMPDYFIPIDSSLNNVYFGKLVNQGLIYQFAFDYTDKNRKKLQSISLEKFLNDFRINDPIFSEFIAFAVKSGVQRDLSNLVLAERIIKIRLKAYIARNLYDNEGFYRVLYSDDEMVKKAMEKGLGDFSIS